MKNKINQNIKTTLSTKYKLFYTLKNSSINHEIKLNDYWLSDNEKEQVYKIAYRENLKQMQKVNKYTISKNKEPLYNSFTLVKTQLSIQDKKIKKDIEIIESTLLNNNKEEAEKYV